MRFEAPMPTGKGVFRGLLAVIVLLVLMSIAGQFSAYFLGHDYVKGLVPASYVASENSFPTWYSSAALALAAGLTALVAYYHRVRGDAFRNHWVVLALIFLAFSAEEVASLHETTIEPIRDTLGVGGFFFFAWVIPGALFALVAAIGFWRFLMHLPTPTRNRFMLAGGLFVLGALGVEMVGGRHFEALGRQQNFTYSMIVAVEEFLEMAGVALFIGAVVDYMRDHLGWTRVELGSAEGPAGSDGG